MLYRQHESNEVGANSGWKSFKQRLSVMLQGDGFNKALQQADFIEQSNLAPIKLLRSSSRLSLLKLSLFSFQCRRQLSHKMFFFIICIIFAIKGYEYNEQK